MEAVTPGAAHAMLGMLYAPAFPGFTDWKLAAQYYRKAVDAGNAGCGFYLARVYRGHGEEAGVSHEEMRELLERAEPVNACGQLYELLCASCEVLEDYDTAMKYYKRWHKYDPEDSDCCIGLASNYAMGRGVKRDFEIAFRYYQKAANLGDSYGMHMVGVMYYDGLGVRRNYKRAVDYFRRALEHGETQALYYLGTCYRDGLGVRQDVDKARQYLAEGKRMVFLSVMWRRLCWSWMRLLHRKSWTEWLPCWKKPGPCWMTVMKKCCSTSSCWRALLKSSEKSSLPV